MLGARAELRQGMVLVCLARVAEENFRKTFEVAE